MTFSRSDIAAGFITRLDTVGAKKAVKELASLLVEQRLYRQVDAILMDISREYAKKHGIVEAEVRTAFLLSESIKKELIAHVKQQTNAKTVILHEALDKSILGGVVVTAPDMELDLSLKTKLAKLRA